MVSSTSWITRSSTIISMLLFINFVSFRIFCRLPFNYKSLWAYPFAISVQFFAVYMPLRYIECFVSLGVTIFLFSLSLAKDIGNFVRAIDESARAKKHREIICKQISKMIQFTNLQGLVVLFHFLLKFHFKWMIHFLHFPRYLRVFSEIFEITFLVLFMGCTGTKFRR